MTHAEPCPGCGGFFAPSTGPVHRYMVSSPACWRAFGALMAAEYADPRLMPVHRLSVDAYAVQHPGGDNRQAIQSVGLHLSRLYMQLHRRLSPAEAHDFMLRAGKRKAELEKVVPPRFFTITVSDVAQAAGSAKHEELVRAWAEAAWADWAHVHDAIRRWANSI